MLLVRLPTIDDLDRPKLCQALVKFADGPIVPDTNQDGHFMGQRKKITEDKNYPQARSS